MVTGDGLSVGIVGLGSAGRRLFRHLSALGVRDFIGWDPVGFPEGAATIGQARSLDDVVQCRPDIIAICSPAKWHQVQVHEVVTRAHANLRALFIEKPLATSRELLMTSWFEDAGIPIVMGYNRRFHPAIAALERGRPFKQAEFWIVADLASWPGTAYGDAIAECSHEIDLALWAIGTSTVVGADIDPDLRRARILLDSGIAKAAIAIDDVRGADEGRGFEVVGADGQGAMKRFGSTDEGIETSYREMAAHLIAVAHGARPAVTIHDGIAVMRVIQEAMRCAARVTS